MVLPSHTIAAKLNPIRSAPAIAFKPHLLLHKIPNPRHIAHRRHRIHSRSERCKIDTTITNSASHAYGIDLIVFSNAGFLDTSWSDADPNNDGSGVIGPNPFVFGAGGEATIQVSQNGTEWFTASITTLDLFPTLGYSDYATTTPGAHGSIESDFAQAMDPSLTLDDLAGMSFAEIVALYDGSGGGIGIDITSSGLDSASYVRFLNDSGEAFEIDAVAAASQ